MNRVEISKLWSAAWANPFFKQRLQLGLIIWIVVLIAFPFFFTFIETRNGVEFHDIFLAKLPAFDVSVPTFLIIWSMFLLLFYRAIHNPQLFLLFLWGFIVLSISRIITIYFLPLNPPENLIPLRDPITNLFYGSTHKFVTKDLFYSGHTSTQFLMFLCFTKRTDKLLALVSTIIVALLVLVQHVHYSIDVLVAPLFTYIVYIISKSIVKV